MQTKRFCETHILSCRIPKRFCLLFAAHVENVLRKYAVLGDKAAQSIGVVYGVALEVFCYKEEALLDVESRATLLTL